MSKFFEALEQAEQERIQQEETEQQSRAPAFEPATAPAARATAVEPERPARAPGDAAVAPPRRKWELRDTPLGDIDDHLVGILNPASAEAEQYRTLCCSLEQAHKDAGLRLLAVTSAGGGDGKTVTAINLAATLSQTAANRVLLIDADLRHPSVEEQLGLAYSEGPGLIDAIANPDLSLRDVARTFPTLNLSVVTAGQVFDSPYETLKSPRMEKLVQDARQSYDYVIVDTPPIVPVPDCRLIARWVDSFLIVVAAHQTPRKLLEEALNIVEPGKVLGIVFNGDDVPLSRYYNYSYVAGRAHNASAGGWNARLVNRSAAFSRSSAPGRP